MNLTYKFDARKEKIFFSSDFHAYHSHFGDDILGEKCPPIWKERGYSSCDDMNAHIISETNRLVSPEDTLIFHGDLTLRASVEKTENFLSEINCQNILCIAGNHESFTDKIYLRELAKLNLPPEIRCAYPLRYNNVVFCGPEIVSYIKWGDTKNSTMVIVSSHFPRTIWDNVKHGWAHCCGHSHSGFKDTHPLTNDNGKIMDVGWDYFKRPVEFWELKSLMDKKEIVKKDKNH